MCINNLAVCVYWCFVSIDSSEQFLVITEAKAKDTETVKTSLELLETSQALVPLLDRNAKVQFVTLK